MRADEAIDAGEGKQEARIVLPKRHMASGVLYAFMAPSGILKLFLDDGAQAVNANLHEICRDDWEVYKPTPKPEPCEACLSLSETENLLSTLLRPRWGDVDYAAIFSPGGMTEVKSIETADEEMDRLVITHGLMVVCKALGPLLKQACACGKEGE